MALLLIASKMNEIYPPKITAMLAKCKKVIAKEEIVALEAGLLAAFEFEVALDSNAFTIMHGILGCLYA